MTEQNSYHFIALYVCALTFMLLWSCKACESPAAWSLKNAFEVVATEQAGEWGLS